MSLGRLFSVPLSLRLTAARPLTPHCLRSHRRTPRYDTICFSAAQRTRSQLRLQQYTTPTVYVGTRLLSPHCPACIPGTSLPLSVAWPCTGAVSCFMGMCTRRRACVHAWRAAAGSVHQPQRRVPDTRRRVGCPRRPRDAAVSRQRRLPVAGS